MRPVLRSGPAPDRGEHVAGDSLRARRPPDRSAARRRVPGAGRDRAAAQLDGADPCRARHRPGLPGGQRRPAPAADDRLRRLARGGLRRLGARDSTELLEGGEGVSSDPGTHAGGSSTAPGGAAGAPSEEELRAAYEAELSRITPAEMMLQAAVSLLNIGARRLGLTGAPDPAQTDPAGRPDAQAGAQRDLGQVRDAIDGVRALLEILERSSPEQLRPVRDALSQLQIAYAREAQA